MTIKELTQEMYEQAYNSGDMELYALLVKIRSLEKKGWQHDYNYV